MMKASDVINDVENINKEYHLMNNISKDLALELEKEGKKGKLSGYYISVKDCICVKDVESRAGSKILEGYLPVFDATVIAKVKKEGGVIIGKTAQDAFGFGSFSVNVGVGMKIPLNPIDNERSCGGSSGGSAGITYALTKKEIKHISIGESTGGSIVCPASFCGVVGLCPTYGRISRYGLMDYANSLDKIGAIAANVHDAALLLEVMSGHDDKESTSLKKDVDRYTSYLGKDVKDLRIGMIKEAFGEGVNKDVEKAVRDSIEKLKKKGATVGEISLPLAKEYGVSCYYVIAMAEASTNLAKYCGIRYGASDKNMNISFNEYFSNVRSENFNDEDKRRIMIGTFTRMAGTRDAFYLKAMKIRTKIIDEYKKAFEKYDVLVCPTMPVIAPKFTEIAKLTPLENYMMDIMTVGPNLAGVPHITVPCGESEGMPIGIMFIADHLNEGKIIQAASSVEEMQ